MTWVTAMTTDYGYPRWKIVVMNTCITVPSHARSFARSIFLRFSHLITVPSHARRKATTPKFFSVRQHAGSLLSVVVPFSRCFYDVTAGLPGLVGPANQPCLPSHLIFTLSLFSPFSPRVGSKASVPSCWENVLQSGKTFCREVTLSYEVFL